MGPNWCRWQAVEFEEMIFQSKGHAMELPIVWTHCRILISRILYHTAGDAHKVSVVMQTAPTLWVSNLQSVNIKTTDELLQKLSLMEDLLIDHWKSNLCRESEKRREAESPRARPRYRLQRKTVNMAERFELEGEEGFQGEDYFLASEIDKAEAKVFVSETRKDKGKFRVCPL